MTDFQKKKLTHFFNILDFNGTGRLEIEDFAELSENIRATFNFEDGGKEHTKVAKKCTRFFHQLLEKIGHQKMYIDLDSWLEFTEVAIIQAIDEDILDDYVDVFVGFFFDLFDANNDGFISIAEYHQLFEIYKIDKSNINDFFAKIDRNNDLRLSRYELLYAGKVFFTTNDKKLRGNWIFGELNDEPYEFSRS
ncbi:MAG: EF-hand domain-containing protein [Cyclobacteriaceae bacterium]